MDESPLHDRLAAVTAGMTYREIGEITGTNAETARRYITGQAPSVEFVIRLCQRKGINGQWLLSGQGPMRVSDIKSASLREAGPGELLSAMAVAIETMRDRLDRVERFVHTLETRLRVASAPALPTTDNAHGANTPLVQEADRARTRQLTPPIVRTDAAAKAISAAGKRLEPGPPGADGRAPARAQRIADAAAERSRPGDD